MSDFGPKRQGTESSEKALRGRPKKKTGYDREKEIKSLIQHEVYTIKKMTDSNPNAPEQIASTTELWSLIISYERHPFRTVRGVPFTYSVTRSPGRGGRHYSGENVDGYGNELWISTTEGVKKKSISRSTVELAYRRMISGEIKGPRSLGVPGAGSYLYPVLKEIMTKYPAKMAKENKAEDLRQLEDTIEGIILQAEICTELEKMWRSADNQG